MSEMKDPVKQEGQTIPTLEDPVESGISLIRLAGLLAIVGVTLIVWQMVRLEWHQKLWSTRARWIEKVNNTFS